MTTILGPSYIYRATMRPLAKQALMDGDTWWMDVDLGLRVHTFTKIRLHRYSAPEMSTPEGPPAKEKALARLYAATSILIQTYHDALSHDRWVADVYVDGQLLGPLLVSDGAVVAVP